MNVRQAVIIAGGKSTRLRPYTKSYPRPLIQLRGKPLLHYAIHSLQKVGVDKITLVLGFAHDKIVSYFAKHAAEYPNVEFSFFIEEQPLGTGGALSVLDAQGKLDAHFFALNADIVTDANLDSFKKFHQKQTQNGALATVLLAPVPVLDVHRFGVADLHDGMITRFVEKPKTEDAPGNLINAGRYVYERAALSYAKKKPDGGFNVETDLFPYLAAAGKLAGFVPHKPGSLYWNDVGTHDSLHRLSEDEKSGALDWMFE